MDESISSNSGSIKGFTKRQEAKNISCKNSTTYEINWKYKTNLSGEEVAIFTGKQIEGFNQKKIKKPIAAGDIVRFKRQDHANNGLKATVKSILKPLTAADMAEQGKDIRSLAKFPPVYTLEFLKTPYSQEDQVSKIKTSNSEELQKIINFKSNLCINWRKEALLNHLKSTTDKSLEQRESNRLKFNTYTKDQYGIEKDTILINKIQREMKKIFMRNKKFTPDAISAWESENYQEYNKDELIPPDGTYYIMGVSFVEMSKKKILTNKDVCDKNPPHYKLWVTVKVKLRKEAEDIGSDILFNGKLFLGCDEKKQNILNILNEIKNEAEKGFKNITDKANIPNLKKGKNDNQCAYTDAPINESDIKEDVDVIQGFLKNQKVMVASKDLKWEGMVPGKISNKKKTTPPTYDIMLDSNIMIRNVETNFIRPIDDMAGGKKRKTKKRRRRRRKKTKKRRRR